MKYKAILLNYENHSYVRLKFDKISQEFFENNLHKIIHS